MPSSYDLTCILTGHREGRLSVPSLRSFHLAVAAARAEGFTVEKVFCLDRPDALTSQLFTAFRDPDTRLEVYDFADQGKVRNAATENAKGRYTAFLDGDDLWSEDWLVQALRFLNGRPETHIAHPAYNYFFEGQATIFTHVDQESPDFRLDLLRLANYWDALCVCPTRIYRDIPFCDRNIAGGYAYEDWVWNCQTVSAGMIHKVVPNSVLFKRRQKLSQNIHAGVNKSLPIPHELVRYNHPLYASA